MKQNYTPETFGKLGAERARSVLCRDIQTGDIGQGRTALRSLAVQNRLGFREVLLRARTGEPIDLYALVSPAYMNDLSLSSDPKYFTRSSQGLESRVPRKLKAAVEAIQFLSGYFRFRTHLVVADTGLLLSSDYENPQFLKESIQTVQDLYRSRFTTIMPNTPCEVMKLSDIVSDGTSRVLDMSFTPIRDDCVRIIRENALAPESLLKNLDILIKAFGLTVTYYELQGYFEESRLLGERLSRSIIVNVEGTSVGNKLLTKGKGNLCTDRGAKATGIRDRINQKGSNLLIGGVVSLK